MKRRHVTYWIIALVVVGFLTIWFSSSMVRMKETEAYSVNDAALSDRILIASQGSEFKDEVVKKLVNAFDTLPVFIRVIDVSELDGIDEADWSVIVIIHTVEYWKPPKPVLAFLDRTNNRQKLIMLSTSGEGTFELEGIDGISSASRLTEAGEKADEIIERITSHIMFNNLARQGIH